MASVVIGAGVMGSAMALALDRAGESVTVCATEFDLEVVERIRKTGEHPGLGHAFPSSISLVEPAGWDSVLGDAGIVVVAVASIGVRRMVREAAPHLKAGAVWAVASKGWDPETAQPLSAVIEEESPHHPVVVVVGPSLASEIAGETPTALVCASTDAEAARRVAGAISSGSVRCFVTDDVPGVEVGSALKNVLAIAIGMCDGIAERKGRPMTNTKAALFSRGLVEMARLAEALGGRAGTVMGLAGAGDLFVTVLGGRNGRFGRLVGTGLAPARALEEMGTTVEGYDNTREAVVLARRFSLELPIVEAVYSVLHEEAEPDAAIVSLVSGGVEREL